MFHAFSLTSVLLRLAWNDLLLAVTDFGFLPRCSSSSHFTFSYCRHKQSLPETPVRSLIQQIFIIYSTTCEGQCIILMNTKSVLKERGDIQINMSCDAKGTSWGREDRDLRASFPWGIREEPQTTEHFCEDLKEVGRALCVYHLYRMHCYLPDTMAVFLCVCVSSQCIFKISKDNAPYKIHTISMLLPMWTFGENIFLIMNKGKKMKFSFPYVNI